MQYIRIKNLQPTDTDVNEKHNEQQATADDRRSLQVPWISTVLRCFRDWKTILWLSSNDVAFLSMTI